MAGYQGNRHEILLEESLVWSAASYICYSSMMLIVAAMYVWQYMHDIYHVYSGADISRIKSQLYIVYTFVYSSTVTCLGRPGFHVQWGIYDQARSTCFITVKVSL